MIRVVVVMMPLMVSYDAIDISGDDDARAGVRASVWQCGCTPILKSPLNLPKYVFFNTVSAPVCGYCVRLSAIGF